jgi:hypothetical protein
MSSQTHNPADQLRRLIAEGSISEDALQAITGIDPQKLRLFLEDTPSGTPGLSSKPQALSDDESARVSILAASLTAGLRIDHDERLKAIFESLTIGCRLTLQNLAQLTGLDVEDMEAVLNDPRTVSTEKKYALAVSGLYLINVVNHARGQ